MVIRVSLKYCASSKHLPDFKSKNTTMRPFSYTNFLSYSILMKFISSAALFKLTHFDWQMHWATPLRYLYILQCILVYTSYQRIASSLQRCYICEGGLVKYRISMSPWRKAERSQAWEFSWPGRRFPCSSSRIGLPSSNHCSTAKQKCSGQRFSEK